MWSSTSFLLPWLSLHDQWDDFEDTRALRELKPDLVLFTGDFGDENVELVHSISKLNFLKAAILGNHDCWYTAELFSRQDVSPGYSPCKSECNAVDAQLQSLQDSHIGYKRMDISELKLSIIGARPFSTGGNTFGPAYGIITQRFGIQGMNHSAGKISSLALQAPTGHVLVFLGHNGPTGLGSKPMDICGKDWSAKSSGDHGDPDLEAALKKVKERGSHNVQLVIFGHMHKTLSLGRGERTMLVRGQDNIIYVNAAVVPRVIAIDASKCHPNNTGLQTFRNFTVIDLNNGQVEKISETWVRVGDNVSVDHEHILYSSLTPQQSV
ncbi:hypothetical protein GOP47_0021814 [Adiantum capillus-veneris]|uniref:Calcineurin-like phosphoesterase domain-containing protein n=1 Tax=Adiantum capillus-veneris TaxID=13818 RepID=A0A9D4U922_ADICA|nr:hypothetical protein GOP47_0021814 [Adiantum capillus-veneris]